MARHSRVRPSRAPASPRLFRRLFGARRSVRRLVPRERRALGFDGKTLIHPSQIDTCNAIFAPTEEEVSRARAVIAAFALPENAGKGVIKVDGKMTELLHLEEAKRVVAVAVGIRGLA